jgi:hypothetical protein
VGLDEGLGLRDDLRPVGLRGVSVMKLLRKKTWITPGMAKRDLANFELAASSGIETSDSVLR